MRTGRFHGFLPVLLRLLRRCGVIGPARFFGFADYVARIVDPGYASKTVIWTPGA
jgi:hypothetical protein